MAATVLILKKVNVQMEKTLATAKTITAISKASEAVITGTHDYSIGDYVKLSGIVGMVELNDMVVRVKSVSTTVSFVAEGVDSTLFNTYVSGGSAFKITAWDTFDNITNLSLPDSPPAELDATTIDAVEKQVVFGFRDAPKGTFNILADPLSVTSVALSAAEDTNTRKAFKLTLINGYIGIFNAYVSGGSGLDGASGGIATGNVALTLRRKTQWFAS